jgi:acetyl-CoA decarbonylase/synthase complex subunit delta
VARPGVVPPPDGLEYILATLEKVRTLPLPPRVDPSLPPEQQLAALQVSTALNLLTAGANMLLMSSLSVPQATSAPPASGETAARVPTAAPLLPTVERNAAEVDLAALPLRVAAVQTIEAPTIEAPIAPALIVTPTSFSVPPEKVHVTIRTVRLGGSGTRTSAVTIGGAAALPFRHFEGDTGRPPVIAMEVFDAEPRGYPDSLRRAYAALLADPAAMARYCVEKLGADVISVRLAGTHPDHGDHSPEEAAAVVGAVLQAVGVPVIVTGPNHYEKNNAVMKHVAAACAGENLLLGWAETDNYKTLAAAALGYNHCLVAQSPIDVNMAKQLNILLTNMGVPADRIVMDPLTGAIGYGLEYTYSVMERSRTAAFTGDPMLAMPILGTPGYEVARTKESRAPRQAFPLWGPEEERGALLEIATAMSLLNAGADLLILYHPLAATTVKRKVAEMTRVGA